MAYHQAVIDALDKTLIPNAKNAELKNRLVKTRHSWLTSSMPSRFNYEGRADCEVMVDVGRVSRRRNPTAAVLTVHVGLRCANPTYENMKPNRLLAQ